LRDSVEDGVKNLLVNGTGRDGVLKDDVLNDQAQNLKHFLSGKSISVQYEVEGVEVLA
jgi:hypothetical protein